MIPISDTTIFTKRIFLMIDSVLLRAAVFDTQSLTAEKSTLDFFGPRPDSCSEPVTSAHEGELTRRLLSNQNARALILEELGLAPSTNWALEVTRPFTSQNNKPGDIDCVLCDLKRPDRSVALEFKRVKVVAAESGDQHINRIDALGRGAAQANALAQVGFSRTFLSLIAVVDGRKDRMNNFAFRGASVGTFKRLVCASLEMPLTPEVGILYVELVQPVEAEFEVAGAVAVGTLRGARHHEQSQWFTNVVQRFMSETEGHRQD